MGNSLLVTYKQKGNCSKSQGQATLKTGQNSPDLKIGK
jgi:hypothetical protein